MPEPSRPRCAGGRASSQGARARAVARCRSCRAADDHDDNRCSPSTRPSALTRSSSSSPPAVRLASTSGTLNGRPSCSRSTTTCSTGRPERCRFARRGRGAANRSGLPGMSRRDFVGPARGDRVHRREKRVDVADFAGRPIPSPATSERAKSTRACAESCTASSLIAEPAEGGCGADADQAEAHIARTRRRLSARPRAACAPPSVGWNEGFLRRCVPYPLAGSCDLLFSVPRRRRPVARESERETNMP